MLIKCSTNCIWKGLQSVNDHQGHSRSLPLLSFDSPYTISYYSSIVSISLSCTVFEILTLICQKIKTSRDFTTPIWGSLPPRDKYFPDQPVHKIWRFYLQPFQRNLTGCKLLRKITRPKPRAFQGWSVIRRLTLDIVCKHTYIDNVCALGVTQEVSSFSSSEDISWGVKF